MSARCRSVLFLSLLLGLTSTLSAAPVVVTSCGNNSAALAEFRNLLGNPINGAAPGSQPLGRRDINWDGVPATVTNNNTFPAAFFNANSTRGLVLSTLGSGLRVSDNNFSDINSTYSTQLAAFTPTKTFAAVGSNIVDVTFQVPGTANEAAVSAFGVVFSDVDVAGSTSLEFFNGSASLGTYAAPARCDATGHSFVGVAFTDGQRATRVRITSGSGAPAAGVNDVSAGGTLDVVVMDDFLYSEPFAAGTLFSAILRGVNEVPPAGTGTGVAAITINAQNNTVSHSIFVQNVTSPTAAHIHRGAAGVNGPIVVDLTPSFNASGVSTGASAASSAAVAEILANPSNFYVNVHNADFPGGAARGQLSSPAGLGAGRTVIPVAGRVEGANNSLFRTDVRLVNLSGTSVEVLAEYYPTGSVTGAPGASNSITLAPAEQKVLNDAVKSLFNVDSGLGAIVFTSSRAVTVAARIYNDQRSSGKGTYGQFVPGFEQTSIAANGALALLSNQPASTNGSRTNIGWFNDSANTVSVTFRAYGETGALLATSQQTIGPFVQQQMPLGALFPTLAAADDLYVTFDSGTSPLVVYASVIDNTSGDAIFVPAHR